MSSFSVEKIIDASRNIEIKINIVGTASTELTNSVVFDASTYLNKTVNKKLISAKYCLNGFSAQLIWDATSPVNLIELEKDHYSCFERDGGLSNTAFAGRTGDILLTTTGLSTEMLGYIILNIQNKKDS